MVRKVTIALLMLSMALFAACDQKELEALKQENQRLSQEISALAPAKKAAEKLQFLTAKMSGIRVIIETSEGNIECSFYADKAPIHVWNFITRAESGFFTNTQFHRVIPGFMFQGGDPNSADSDPYNDGMGGPAVPIPHEFNTIHHKPGVLSMARVSDPAMGAGTQFFIMHGDSPHLDNQYTVFGEVVKGMDVVNKIAQTQTNQSDPRLRDRPVKAMVIKRMVVVKPQ